MNEMKFDIFGSCVTRDAFSYLDKDNLLGRYLARSSISSIKSKVAKNIVPNLTSQFQNKLVNIDLNKSHLEIINNSSSNYCILDFIDERFNIAKFGDTLITLSYEALQVPEIKEISEIIKFDCDEKFDLFCEGINYLKTHTSKNIIVNKVYLSEVDINNNDITKDFKYIDELNSYLEKLYDYCSHLSLEEITYNKSYKADPNHKWGLAPFHYEIDLYKDFFIKLQEKVGGNIAK